MINREVWMIVEDLLLQKEIKSILKEQNIPYHNVVDLEKDPSYAKIDFAKLAENLDTYRHQSKDFIIYLKEPSPIMADAKNMIDLVSEQNLNIVKNWTYRFNKLHQVILKNTHNIKSKIIYLTGQMSSDNPFHEIITNYVYNYYQGTNIELRPYGVALNMLYREANQPFVGLRNELLQIFKKPENKYLYTNLTRTQLKQLIVKNKPVSKNNLIDWKQKEKRVAVVTGASGGLGFAIAQYLVDRNWKVYSFSRTQQTKGGIIYIQCDLTNIEDVRLKTDMLLAKEEKIHLLVNNSGFGLGASMENTSTEEFDSMYQINVIGSMRMIRRLATPISKAKGHIVNIGSLAGILPVPFQMGYSLTKVLIDCYTELLHEYLNGKQIHIINLMPGDTKTNFAKHRKISENEKDSRYITRINASIKKMEKDEKNGHKPIRVARALWAAINNSCIPIRITLGKYKLFFKLARLLGPKAVEEIMFQLYAKKESL